MANRKIYLVDSENVSCEWLALCPKLGSRDNIVLFYTEKSPFISYPNLVRILPYLEKLELVQCYMGPNALDFQMCTYLGAKLAKPTKTEYFIVSNDRGYLPVVKFWKDRGRLISQINHAGLMRLTAENKQKNLGKQLSKPEELPRKEFPTLMEAVRDVVLQEMEKPEGGSVQPESGVVGHSVPSVPKKIVSRTAVKSSAQAECTPKKQPEEENASTKADQPSAVQPNSKETETVVPTKEETTKSTPKRRTRKSLVQKKVISTHPHTNKEETKEDTPSEQFVTAPKPQNRKKRAPMKKESVNVKEPEPQKASVKEEPTKEQFVTAPKPKKSAKKAPTKKTVKPKTESATKEPHIRTKTKEKEDMSKAELNRMIEAVIGDSMPLKAQSIDKISNVLLEMSTQKLTLVHSGLVKAFDAQMGRDIYRVLKPELPRIFQSINRPAH